VGNWTEFGPGFSCRVINFGGDRGYDYLGTVFFEGGHFPFGLNVEPDLH
jgi:hypothetical protein